MNDKPMWTEAETALELGVERDTLKYWRHTGRHGLPFVKVGNAVRYRRKDVEAWIESRKKTCTAACD